jgi:hypothetical protein
LSEIYCPRLLRRIQAALIDSLVLGAIFYGMIFIPNYLGIEPGPIKAGMLILPMVFYDPIFVSLFCSTIGHLCRGLRVRREYEDRKLNIFYSTFAS